MVSEDSQGKNGGPMGQSGVKCGMSGIHEGLEMFCSYKLLLSMWCVSARTGDHYSSPRAWHVRGELWAAPGKHLSSTVSLLQNRTPEHAPFCPTCNGAAASPHLAG